ncbi:hypothetical protein [Streptomyces rubradiris]|uniref:hypothetical protein n=1 Tax=Streptomyces rubradiris TaxID=285531 RepID=UPI00167B09C4|nr:hypothetical protein [Streptomyces rubradiris]
MTLGVKDIASDGHHVRVRLLTSRYTDLSIRYWPWRANYDGYGTAKVWETTVQDAVDGIYNVGVEVATFEGDDRLHYCTDWF